MKHQKKVGHVVAFSFLVSLMYAIVRYNILLGVPWSDLPIYILNKAVSLTIILLVFYGLIFKTIKSDYSRKLWGIIFFLTLLHVLLSTVILSPAYYEKFYNGNKLNLVGSLTLLSGICAFLGFFLSALIMFQRTNKANIAEYDTRLLKLKYVNYIFIGLHVFIMGFPGWFNTSNWPGWLPPVSLLAFILLVLSIIKYQTKTKE